MAKVLKIAAVVIAIAAAIPSGGSSLLAVGLGVSAATASAIAVGVGLASSLIASQPSGAISGNQTEWKADPNAPVPIVFGRTLVGGDIRYRKSHDSKNKYRTLVSVLSGCGPIEAIEGTYADKKLLVFDGQTAHGKTYNRFWQVTQLGACPEPAALSNAIGYGPGRDTSSKLSGYAAAIDTFLFDGEGKDTFTQMPELSWVLHGVHGYDMRLDSTFPGGSGACRWDDETTWVYTENPWIGLASYAIGWHQGPNNVRVGGVGMPISAIDLAAFSEAASIADLNGWKMGGQVTTGDDKWSVMKALAQAGGGEPIRNGATLSCIINAPRVSIATITRDDLIGEASITTTQTARDRVNGIIPRYRSEDHDWETVPAAVVRNAAYLAQDGAERTREVPYTLVQCASGEEPAQAAQLAAYDVANAREASPIVMPLKLRWLGFKAGDCLTIEDAPEFGWIAAKDVMVIRRGLDPSTGAVPLTMRTETAGKHEWAMGQDGTAAPVTDPGELPDMDAPDAADWTFAGTTVDGDGSSIPALVFTGTDPDRVATSALLQYYQGASAPASESDWISSAVLPNGGPPVIETAVGANLEYVGSVQYIYPTGQSERLVLGPVTTGALGLSGAPAVTEFIVFGESGALEYSFINPTAAGWDHVILMMGNSPDITAAADSGEVPGGASGVLVTGTITGVAPGNYFVWAQTYDATSNLLSTVGPIFSVVI